MKNNFVNLLKLEDRILFEAAAAADIVEAADAVQNDPNANVSESERQSENEQMALKNAPVENKGADNNSSVEQTPENIADIDTYIDALVNGNISSPDTKELVVINSSVDNIDEILAGLNQNQDVLILNQYNGLQELNDYLDANGSSYSAIHILTHGNKGEFIFNGKVIDNDSFSDTEWNSVGEHLTSGGDIMIYGCNVASGEDGQLLINKIAAATGADVAASTDTTGVSGDWDLEYASGKISADTLEFSDYKKDLEAFTVTSSGELQDAVTDCEAGGNHTIFLENDIIATDTVYGNFSYESSITIRSLEGNKFTITSADGYSIFNFTDTGDAITNITITDIIFADSENTYIENALDFTYIDSLEINNSEFKNFDDYAVNFWGDGSGSVTINNSEFTGNKGAVNVFDAALNVSKTYFSQNGGVDHGGAIKIDTYSDIVIQNSSFHNNSAERRGGAIDITSYGGNINITNSTFHSNSSGDRGGAISVFSESGAEISVSDSTFTCNTATGTDGGGALFLNNTTASIQNTLLIENTGSDIRAAGSADVSISSSMLTTAVSRMDTATVDDSGAMISADYTFANVFKGNSFDAQNHTIAPNAFHAAAWSGSAVNALDQNGSSRNVINSALGITNTYYTIGAVTAKVGITVDQGDYNTTYQGTEITSFENHLTFSYAGKELGVINPALLTGATALLSSNATIRNAGTYTDAVTASNASINSSSDAIVFDYKPGTLTVDKATLNVVINDQGDIVYGTAVTPGYSSDVLGTDSVNATLNVSGGKSSAGYYTVGTHTISCSNITVNDGNGGNNYNVSAVADKSFEVSRKGITVATDITTEKVYDGTTSVEANASITDAVAGDDVTINAAWQYNSANVTEANLINNTLWQLSGSDAGNYIIVTAAPDGIAAAITAKPVEVSFSSNEPYYYNGYDQSSSISASYKDVNGNDVSLNVNWNGQKFFNPGSYTVTAEFAVEDANYQLVNATKVFVMNSDPAPPAPPTGGEGPAGYNDSIPSIWGEMLASGNTTPTDGNIYTMNWSELVSASMYRGHSMEYNGQIYYDINHGSGMPYIRVSIDTLKYRPWAINEPARELSFCITETTEISTPQALHIGQELFVDSNHPASDFEHLFEKRGGVMSYFHNPVYVERDYSAEDIGTNLAAVPETTPLQDIVSDDDIYRDIPLIAAEVSQKAANLKSDIERVLDEMFSSQLQEPADGKRG